MKRFDFEQQHGELGQMRALVKAQAEPAKRRPLEAFATVAEWAAQDAAPSANAQQAQPVAWRHSHTLCLYEMREDVPLADGDEWAEPLYLATPAPTASREAWAVELIQAAVDIMTPEQVGQWAGVRAFLETSAPSAAPAELTDEQIVRAWHEACEDAGTNQEAAITMVRAMLAASPADQEEDA